MANLKKVRVIAGPTGPTGTYKGVHIFANITGPTGLFAQWQQVNAAQMGPTGTFETVYPVGASATGLHQTVIINGYTGPA